MTKEEYKKWVLKVKKSRTRVFQNQCKDCTHEAHRCIISGLQNQKTTCNDCPCLETHDEYFACKCEGYPTYIEKVYTKKCKYFKETKNEN